MRVLFFTAFLGWLASVETLAATSPRLYFYRAQEPVGGYQFFRLSAPQFQRMTEELSTVAHFVHLRCEDCQGRPYTGQLATAISLGKVRSLEWAETLAAIDPISNGEVIEALSQMDLAHSQLQTLSLIGPPLTELAMEQLSLIKSRSPTLKSVSFTMAW